MWILWDKKQRDARRLREEYERLVKGLSTDLLRDRQGGGPSSASGGTSKFVGDELLGTPQLSQDIVEETVPGNIRRAEHFIGYLRRLLEYLRQKMKMDHVVQENPKLFLNQLQAGIMTDAKSLR